MRYTDPAAMPPIHPAYCTCRECTHEAHRAFSADIRWQLGGVALAVIAAVLLIAGVAA